MDAFKSKSLEEQSAKLESLIMDFKEQQLPKVDTIEPTAQEVEHTNSQPSFQRWLNEEVVHYT